MIRHSSDFRELIQWKQRSNARLPSPSEACVKDLGITIEQALVYATDREHWFRITEQLRDNLEPAATYIKSGTQKWRTAVTKAKKTKDLRELQYIEESTDPFPNFKAMQIYTDASIKSMVSSQEIRSGAGIVVIPTKKRSNKMFNPTGSYNN